MHTERRSPCVLKWTVTCRRPVIAAVIPLRGLFKMTLVNVAQLLVTAIGALVAIRGETWNDAEQDAERKLGWIHRITLQGWIALACLIATFVLGFASEFLARQALAADQVEKRAFKKQNEKLSEDNQKLLNSVENLTRQIGRVEKTVVLGVGKNAKPNESGEIDHFNFDGTPSTSHKVPLNEYPLSEDGFLSSFELSGGESITVDLVSVGKTSKLQFAEIKIGPLRYKLIEINPRKGIAISKNRIEFTLPSLPKTDEPTHIYFRVDRPREDWELVVKISSPR